MIDYVASQTLISLPGPICAGIGIINLRKEAP